MSDEKIDDGGPAFPSEDFEHGFHQDTIIKHSGMTLRDWFAGQALAGMLANGFQPDEAFKRNGLGAKRDWGKDTYVSASYRLADAMLAARKP